MPPPYPSSVAQRRSRRLLEDNEGGETEWTRLMEAVPRFAKLLAPGGVMLVKGMPALRGGRVLPHSLPGYWAAKWGHLVHVLAIYWYRMLHRRRPALHGRNYSINASWLAVLSPATAGPDSH